MPLAVSIDQLCVRHMTSAQPLLSGEPCGQNSPRWERHGNHAPVDKPSSRRFEGRTVADTIICSTASRRVLPAMKREKQTFNSTLLSCEAPAAKGSTTPSPRLSAEPAGFEPAGLASRYAIEPGAGARLQDADRMVQIGRTMRVDPRIGRLPKQACACSGAAAHDPDGS